MTVIYVDTLFLLNATVDYLLLLASARLAGEPLARLRFLLGAVLGGLYAVAIFLPGLSFLARPLCRLAAAVLMVLAAFWKSRRLLRQVVIFFALSCAFGGGVLAIALLGGRGLALSNGVLYSGMDLKIVLLSAAGCYGALTLIFQRTGRHTASSGELRPVRLTLGERQVSLTALVDTGNTLTDPATGRPVLVAEADCVEELLPPESGPVRPTCVTRRGRWSGWRTPGGGGSACSPTARWGWIGGCCWRCGWTRCRWERRTGAPCWPPSPPPRCPTGEATVLSWGPTEMERKEGP